MLLLNSIMPTVPVFAERNNNQTDCENAGWVWNDNNCVFEDQTHCEGVGWTWNGSCSFSAPVIDPDPGLAPTPECTWWEGIPADAEKWATNPGSDTAWSYQPNKAISSLWVCEWRCGEWKHLEDSICVNNPVITYDYIHSADSWNNAYYDNSGLKTYLDDNTGYPYQGWKEDRWSITYSKRCGEEYYNETTEEGQTNNPGFRDDANCVPSWHGAIYNSTSSANAYASYPWVVVNFSKSVEGIISISDGTTTKYRGSAWWKSSQSEAGNKTFSSYSIASIPAQLWSSYAITDDDGTTTFVRNNLEIKLILSDGTIVTASEAEYQTCDAWEHFDWTSCVANTKAAVDCIPASQVANAATYEAIPTWNAEYNTYINWACTVTTCADEYHVKDGACVSNADTTSCTPVPTEDKDLNGIYDEGEQVGISWDWEAWSTPATCKLVSCNNWATLSDWVCKFTVTFDAKGGTFTDPTSVLAVPWTTINAPKNPTKNNLAFGGWYTSTDEGITLSAEAFDFDHETKWKITWNITLYAKWIDDVQVPSGTTLQDGAEIPVLETTSENLAATIFVWLSDSEKSELWITSETQGNLQWEKKLVFKDNNGNTIEWSKQFTKAVLVKVPVRDNTQKIKIFIKHGDNPFWLEWLATGPTECIDGTPVNNVYHGEFLTTTTDSIDIWTCEASIVEATSPEAVAKIVVDGGAGDIYYDSLRDAIEWATAGATIKLVADDHVSFADTAGKREITINKNITIDGQKTLTENYTIYGINDYAYTSSKGDHDIFISAWNVTIKNLNISEFAGAKTNNYRTYPIWTSQAYAGNLTLQNVNIDKFNRTAININNWTVTIDGCTITWDAPTTREESSDWFQWWIDNVNGTVTVTNTTITWMWAYDSDWDRDVGAAVQISWNGTINLWEGNELNGDYALVAGNGGRDNEVWDPQSWKIIVTDWIINGKIFAAPEAESHSINIKWWIFSDPVPMEYCAEGFNPATTDDGKNTVKAWYKVTFIPTSTADSFTWYINPYDSIGSNKPVDPTRTNFTFGWWYTNPAVESTKYDFNSQVTSDLTLKAKWKNNVIFQSNWGSTVASQTVDDGWLIEEPSDPTRDGYDFKWWYEDDEFAYKWIFDTNMVSESPKTLYAKWEATPDAVVYTVSHVKPYSSK